MLRLSKADREHLQKEVDLHKSLNHPNIIKFMGSATEKNMAYFLLEYAGNGCLFFYIDSKKGLPEELALRFTYQTVLAVAYLHDRDLIHRDIKPENILLDEQFNIKLCDFGWSCQLESGSFRTSICGTYEYMSPEIVYKRTHTNKVDIWCLGILLYEMLHGFPPFEAESMKDIKNQFQQKNICINKNLGYFTKDLLKKLLRRNEEERPDINQIKNHPAFLENMQKFAEPLNKMDFALLIQSFLINSGGGRGRTLPEIINSKSQKNVNLAKKYNTSLNNKKQDETTNIHKQQNPLKKSKLLVGNKVYNFSKKKLTQNNFNSFSTRTIRLGPVIENESKRTTYMDKYKKNANNGVHIQYPRNNEKTKPPLSSKFTYGKHYKTYQSLVKRITGEKGNNKQLPKYQSTRNIYERKDGKPKSYLLNNKPNNLTNGTIQYYSKKQTKLQSPVKKETSQNDISPIKKETIQDYKKYAEDKKNKQKFKSLESNKHYLSRAKFYSQRKILRYDQVSNSKQEGKGPKVIRRIKLNSKHFASSKILPEPSYQPIQKDLSKNQELPKKFNKYYSENLLIKGNNQKGVDTSYRQKIFGTMKAEPKRNFTKKKESYEYVEFKRLNKKPPELNLNGIKNEQKHKKDRTSIVMDTYNLKSDRMKKDSVSSISSHKFKFYSTRNIITRHSKRNSGVTIIKRYVI